MKRISALLSLLYFLILQTNIKAQNTPLPLTQDEKKQVVDSVSKRLIDHYIFPEIAKKGSRIHF